MVVVLLYDHLLTVGDEVTYVWTPRLKRSSACFLLFHYFALLSNLTMVAFFLMDLGPEVDPLSEASCELKLLQM